jgi:hypothetical protein
MVAVAAEDLVPEIQALQAVAEVIQAQVPELLLLVQELLAKEIVAVLVTDKTVTDFKAQAVVVAVLLLQVQHQHLLLVETVVQVQLLHILVHQQHMLVVEADQYILQLQQ